MKTMINEPTVIHLGIYGDTAFSILQIIKNTHCKAGGFHFHTTISDQNLFHYISVERAPDNEIILVYKYSTPNVNKTQTWLASVVKGFAKISTKAKYWQRDNIRKESISKCEYWRRTNDDCLNLFSPDVRMSDMYALYDILKGRKMIWSKFTVSDVKDRIVGQPFDPVRTECEISYREQLAELNAKFKAEAEVEKKRYDSEYLALSTEHQKNIEAIKNAKLQAIAKLDAEYAEIRNAMGGASEQQAVQAA